MLGLESDTLLFVPRLRSDYWIIREFFIVGNYINIICLEPKSLETSPSGQLTQRCPNSSNCLGSTDPLGFRGQRAEFDTIVPTLFRRSEDEQKRHLRARGWFSVAISASHNSNFRYTDDLLDKFGVSVRRRMESPSTTVSQPNSCTGAGTRSSR